MCNKLSVFCLMLAVVAALSVPSTASTISLTTPLKVDTVLDAQKPQCGWFPWSVSWDWTGPISKEFIIAPGPPGSNPKAGLDVYNPGDASSPNHGGGRSRSGGFAFCAGTYQIARNNFGFGTHYIKLTLSQLDENTMYKVYLWSFEHKGVWSIDPCNPESKYAAWSTTNPWTWLKNNGYGIGENPGEPPNGGYGPVKQPDGVEPETAIHDSNMPAGLAQYVLECGAEGGRTPKMAPLDDQTNYVGYMDRYVTSFYAKSDEYGVITIYGWEDDTDWAGSMHIPLNGFMVVPEPATVALLGLGGLALLRRKRA